MNDILIHLPGGLYEKAAASDTVVEQMSPGFDLLGRGRKMPLLNKDLYDPVSGERHRQLLLHESAPTEP
jgi:hypothetical protein